MNKVKDVYKDCKAAVESLDFGKKSMSATHINNVRKQGSKRRLSLLMEPEIH